MIEFWKGGGIQNSLYFEYEGKKNKTKQESNSLELYVSKRHQLVISICKINAIEMLHLRTASFQCPAMLLQFVQQKFALPD